MKINRYLAILVFLGSAAWIATGEFASVGSAADSETEPGVEAAAPAPETQDEAANQLQTVGVAVIPQIEHARSVKISGVTEADKETTLTARTGGIIDELTVKQGDHVTEGQVVARIAPEGRVAAVRSAEQALEQARSEAEAAKKLVEQGTRDQILRNPKDPYTQRLIAAVPVPDPMEQRERRERRRTALG